MRIWTPHLGLAPVCAQRGDHGRVVLGAGRLERDVDVRRVGAGPRVPGRGRREGGFGYRGVGEGGFGYRGVGEGPACLAEGGAGAQRTKGVEGLPGAVRGGVGGRGEC